MDGFVPSGLRQVAHPDPQHRKRQTDLPPDAQADTQVERRHRAVLRASAVGFAGVHCVLEQIFRLRNHPMAPLESSLSLEAACLGQSPGVVDLFHPHYWFELASLHGSLLALALLQPNRSADGSRGHLMSGGSKIYSNF